LYLSPSPGSFPARLNALSTGPLAGLAINRREATKQKPHDRIHSVETTLRYAPPPQPFVISKRNSQTAGPQGKGIAARRVRPVLLIVYLLIDALYTARWR